MSVRSVGSSPVVFTPAVEQPITCMAPEAEPVAPPSGFDGPSGTIKAGEQNFEVSNGQVSFNGQVIGTVNDAGDYSVTYNGQTSAGNVSNLIGAVIEGTLSDGTIFDNSPTGKVQVGTETFTVDDGEVRGQDGKRVGTINDSGDYRLADGSTGNIDDLAGAIYSGSLSNGRRVDNRPDGELQVGSSRYSIKDGEVFKAGQFVGTIDDGGSYRIKDDRGEEVHGLVQDIEGATFKGSLSTGKAFASHATGTVYFGESDYQIQNGRIMHNGTEIGLLGNDGRYRVSLDGRQYEGDLAGAAVIGRLANGSKVSNVVSGSVTVGDKTYNVEAGKVFVGGKRVGSINDRGDFNVNLGGQNVRGNLATVAGASWKVTG